jgi:general nucleoside transport system permease protein
MSIGQFGTAASPLQALKPYLRSRVGVIIISFMVVGFVVMASGIDPVRVYVEMLKGAFGSENAIAETLVYTSPILLTGLAAIVCFRCGMWNVGAEGQLYLGGIAAVGIGFNTIGLPAPLVLPAMALGAIAAGAVWALVPALLRIRFSANEVIVTIMMNFLALVLSTYLISGPWASGSTPITKPIIEDGYLPVLLPGTRLHVDLFIALAAAAVLWIVLNRTVLGYEIRAVGLNPRAAQVAGMPIARLIVASFLMSGAVAGIAGFNEVAGIFHAMPDHMSPGYGFTGVAVALLANLDPGWAVVSALFIGALNVGADSMQRAIGVPTALVWVIEGLILLTLLASGALRRS